MHSKDLVELYNDEQPEMRDLIQEDMDEVVDRIISTENDLIKELIPKDSVDENDVILEIRAGTGGSEASLFAGEILEMYKKYCLLHRWKLIPLSSVEENGMVREAVVEVSGVGVFGKLRFESGVHRVQRVPVTENQGRIHTSTVTVAVLPQVTSVEIDLKPKREHDGQRGAADTHSKRDSCREPGGAVTAAQQGESDEDSDGEAVRAGAEEDPSSAARGA
ncbi:Peptide chain release factor 1 [Smittium culicis]|uniref:Peptide chain release factor 1 n=1 Tax=Smittium culicis TaxID=133412 RepID=A0A1R1Y1X0_9FUNG|nr:Peptide chain release factor 1 [Smittium culicis]